MSRLRNGQLLQNRFQVLSFLGQGNFARVYLCNDQKWRGNLVALKEIPTAHYSDDDYAQFNMLFLREAAFLMQLRHTGLPRVVDFFGENHNYYLALEWVPGHTLEQEVEGRPGVPESEVLRWGHQLAEILRYLHSQTPYPVLLGDLKPANVVLDYTGKLRVIDFGLAHYGRTGQRQSMAMVTPGFSPPEQWAGDPLDERSDIYAWAATLYWCLAPGPLERFRFDFPALSNASSGLNELLLRCLKSDRSERFQRVDQVIQEVGGLQRNTGPGLGRSSPSEILSQLYRERKQKFDF